MRKAVIASQMLCRSGLGTLLRRTAGHMGFIVLNYHRIGDPRASDLDRQVFSATPEMFERQLKFLKAECDVITPADLPELARRPRGNYAMITFDDGYRDNFEVAYPILKSMGMKATFFLVTGFVDHPRLSWWDEIAWMVRRCRKDRIGPTPLVPTALRVDSSRPQATIDHLLGVYKRLSPGACKAFLDQLGEVTGCGRAAAELGRDLWMTWDMIAELRDAGMELGGHTVSHPILSTLSSFDQRLEVMGCLGALEQHLHQPARLFSYPRGKPDAFNVDTRACLAESQVRYAFSYYGGMNSSGITNPLDVRRVGVEVNTPIEHFEALVTWPSLFA